MFGVLALLCLAATADPTSSEPTTITAPTATPQRNADLERLERAFAVDQRIAALERAFIDRDLTLRSADAKRLEDLAGGTVAGGIWSWLKEPIGILSSAAVLTFILGFLKHQLDKRRWAHEKSLAEIEVLNKWRSSYLNSALDPKSPLAQRHAWLRFLATVGEDTSLKSWAAAEVVRIKDYVAVSSERDRLAGKVETLKAQRELLRGPGRTAERAQLDVDIATVNTEFAEKDRRARELEPFSAPPLA